MGRIAPAFDDAGGADRAGGHLGRQRQRASGALLRAAPGRGAVRVRRNAPPATPAAELTKVTMGYTGVDFRAGICRQGKGLFCRAGHRHESGAAAGGSDMVLLTASGDFVAGIGGTGPAFFNAIQQGLPLKVIAPGHQEGSPVATPLMISKANCELGAIKSVADRKGKKISVNARGATEYWLSQALSTAGLTMEDIQLETLAFPDAVAALASGRDRRRDGGRAAGDESRTGWHRHSPAAAISRCRTSSRR